MSVPALLGQADFAMVRLTFEMLAPCHLDPWAWLGLRRGLVASARELHGPRADHWFSPSLAEDPQARRRFQKPAPGFVLRPQPLRRAAWQEGDTQQLELLLLGEGLQLLSALLPIFMHSARTGQLNGACCELVATDCLDCSGNWRPLAQARHEGDLAPDVLSIGWWLDARLPLPAATALTVSTPARLVANGRTLRQPQFRQLFPFMLRRVTSMLYSHCGLEPVADTAPLFAAAAQIGTTWHGCRWVDWHEHGEGSSPVGLGGLTGELSLAGTGREELDWIIALATLFGIGRGAAYGAGRIDMRS